MIWRLLSVYDEKIKFLIDKKWKKYHKDIVMAILDTHINYRTNFHYRTGLGDLVFEKYFPKHRSYTCESFLLL